MRYRRSDIQGGSYFFTVNLLERERTLLVDQVELLRSVVSKIKTNHPFTIDAMIVLPDHLHAIWTLPEGDSNYAIRWRLIKAGFSHGLIGAELCSKSRLKKRERGIWQRRYWEHLIRDDQDYARHVDYIHFNPVKHGYVSRASEWPYSSIHRFIRNGILDMNWGAEAFDDSGYGER
ncbi:REP-associated tyrosine transposase [Amphritea sp. HPY]|uniref:REP-associated tyrosine transposase n=1 Tax=Amphritea sp. HPY TaxID=3421652 RepID=UPI003D7CD687